MILINLLLLLCLSKTWASNDSQPSVLNRPNILIILADDVGTGDIPGYWNTSHVSMPNIGKLSSQGLTFTDAHSSPACAPSRYMLLSGNYAHRGSKVSGTFSFGSGQNQFYGRQKSIAELLRDEAGYNTAMFGKWHLGFAVPTEGKMNKTHILSDPGHDWSRQLVQGPQEVGFNHSVITTAGIQSHPYSFFRDGYLTTEPSDVKFWESGFYNTANGGSVINYRSEGEGDKHWDSSAYNMILVNETTQFIDSHLENRLNAEDPFFSYVALGSVHSPHSPPYFYEGEQIAGAHETKHLDLLKEMDLVVGSLVSVLEDRNLAKNTIIIFSSDNGGIPTSEYTGHRSSGILRGHKATIYEGGHRVPLIMQYPGHFPSGEEREHTVALNDIYATLCDLIDVDIPYLSAVDSVSFAEYAYSNNQTGNLRDQVATWNYLPLGGRGLLHVR